MNDILIKLLLLVIGVFTGLMISRMWLMYHPAGTLRIDTKGETDKYFMDFDISLEELPKRAYILLDIDPYADLSEMRK